MKSGRAQNRDFGNEKDPLTYQGLGLGGGRDLEPGRKRVSNLVVNGGIGLVNALAYDFVPLDSI